jgi:hypothetical protein
MLFLQEFQGSIPFLQMYLCRGALALRPYNAKQEKLGASKFQSTSVDLIYEPGVQTPGCLANCS